MKSAVILLVMLACLGCRSVKPGTETLASAPSDRILLSPRQTISIRDADHGFTAEPITRKLDPDGNIQLPIIGTVHVAGLTPAQAATKIEALYRDGNIYRHVKLMVLREGPVN